MKFLRAFILCLILSFSLTGCAVVNPLYSHVSELRSDLFFGDGELYSVSACYGFKEFPFDNDAKVGTRKYALHFKLNDVHTVDASYSLTLTYADESYSADFKLSPVTHTVTAAFEIEGFNLKEFDVTVSSGGVNETITMTSILPQNTITYTTALDFLYKHQRQLVDGYVNLEGEFDAEIYARVIVKNQTPYWYVGIASGNGNLKALLIDGFNGDVLAIREIF